MADPVFPHWLEHLRTLPPDAPDWGLVPEFIADIISLAEAKQGERQRLPVQAALQILLEKHSSEIQFLGLEDLSRWRAELCDITGIEVCLVELGQLGDLLQQYAALRSSQSLTLAEDRKRRAKLTELEDLITRRCGSLAAFLHPSSGGHGGGQRISTGSSSLATPGEGGYDPGEPTDGPSLSSSTRSGDLPAPSADPGTGIAGVGATPDSSVGVASPGARVRDGGFDCLETPSLNAPVEAASAEVLADLDRTEKSLPPTSPGGEASHEATEDRPIKQSGDGLAPVLSVDDSKPTTSTPGHVAVAGANVTSSDSLDRVDDWVEEPRDADAQGAGEDLAIGVEAPAVGLGSERMTVTVDASPDSSASPQTPPTAPEMALYAVAQWLQKDDDPALWNILGWHLVLERDLPGAYWLCRSLDAIGRTPPAPAPLLAAVQGTRWLSSSDDLVALDLSRIVHEHSTGREQAHQLLQLSAAMRPALLAPSSDMVVWLEVPSGSCEALYDLVHALKEFVHRGIVFHPADIENAMGVDQRQKEILDAVKAAMLWLEDVPLRRTKFRNANEVRLFLGMHDLRELLHPVVQDARGDVSSVREALRQWDRAYAQDRIDEIDERLHRMWRGPIVGTPRAHILGDIEEVRRLAGTWCDLVEREAQFVARGEDWIRSQVRRLRESVEASAAATTAWLMGLMVPEQPVAIRASAACLRDAVTGLLVELRLERESGPEAPADRPPQLDEVGLFATLNRRLLVLPEVELDDTGALVPGSLPSVAPALRDACAEQRTDADAVGGWLERRDYRFTGELCAALDDPAVRQDLMSRCDTELEGARAALRAQIGATREAVERAVVDGLIADAERAEHSSRIEAIDPDVVQCFPPCFRELEEIRGALGAARQRRLAELQAIWERLEGRLSEAIAESTRRTALCDFVRDRLRQEDTRVVDECVARVREALDQNLEPDQIGLSALKDVTVLENFLETGNRIERWLQTADLKLAINELRRGEVPEDLPFRKLIRDRTEEVAGVLEAWRQLKRQGSRGTLVASHVAEILQYLGFSLQPDGAAPVQMIRTGRDWVQIRALMVDGGLARPFPQFGSSCRGSAPFGAYDVVCLWERPGAEMISARLRELKLDTRSVIVLYLGRLTLRQRREVTRASRTDEMALALLDLNLLVYTGLHETRLPVFLRCSLPFGVVVPYTPFQAGDVPPEMFYGRQRLARALLDPAGPCLVFGGRQLGKSALLRHVKRQFDDPERQQHAWVEDIKLIGDPVAGHSSDTLWRRLREGFKYSTLFGKSISTDRPEEIIRHIREAMQVPGRRVLVLLDEADNFLNADAKENFRIVEELRRLMVDTERRFRVIFAGLHNVQRFGLSPNQPLAHFGRPVMVGPLEPTAAQDLVREPIEALGFRFTDGDASILRILSYTNYHAGLIQLFCHALLRRLYDRPAPGMPPYSVTQADVEAVYGTPQVRDSIRERFDWTLAVDSRYQAIAWAMVLDQMAAHDSYARAYAPDQLLALTRDAWRQEFDQVGTDQFRGFLDEMDGLGVLVRDQNGHYRLRSPNLVRLMGTEEEIFARLAELSQRPAHGEYEPDSYHTPLDEQARRYSPLTHSQERSLGRQQHGVGLVFGSEALGFSLLQQALQQLLPPDLSGEAREDRFIHVPSTVTADLIHARLAGLLQAAPKHGEIIAVQVVSMGSGDLLARVEAAHEFCRQQKRHRGPRWLRLLFLFDPGATWNWLDQPADERKRVEDEVDVWTFPRRWDALGVRQRLTQRSLMDRDDVVRTILETTGGWPMLLDALFDRCGELDDPLPRARAIYNEVGTDSPVRESFLSSLGLRTCSLGVRLLDLLRDVGPASSADVAELVQTEDPHLTLAQCTVALQHLERMCCLTLRDDCWHVDDVLAHALASS